MQCKSEWMFHVGAQQWRRRDYSFSWAEAGCSDRSGSVKPLPPSQLMKGTGRTGGKAARDFRVHKLNHRLRAGVRLCWSWLSRWGALITEYNNCTESQNGAAKADLGKLPSNNMVQTRIENPASVIMEHNKPPLVLCYYKFFSEPHCLNLHYI